MHTWIFVYDSDCTLAQGIDFELKGGLLCSSVATQIAKFMGPTWGPTGSCRTQMGPMLAPWTLLSGQASNLDVLETHTYINSYRVVQLKMASFLMSHTKTLLGNLSLFVRDRWIYDCYRVIFNIILRSKNMNYSNGLFIFLTSLISPMSPYRINVTEHS